MKWTAWVPWAGVVVVTAGVLCLLTSKVEDALGKNLPTVIQATATVALLGVTFVYVLATQSLAKAAAEDPAFTKAAPHRAACDES